MNEMIVRDPSQMQAQASGVAEACKQIVEATALVIEKRRYVRVEGWQAIANGFGCTASARDVTKIYDDANGEFVGFRAIGEVKRQTDGLVIATGEGFIGVDEPRWFGGTSEVWDKQRRKMVTKTWRPAPEYAARAMAQTRAISRACRAAFAFVVVMIDKELSTTPAEEADPGDEPHGQERTDEPQHPAAAPPRNGEPIPAWQDVTCSYGKKDGKLRGQRLGDLTTYNLRFLYKTFVADAPKLDDKDKEMAAALIRWADETGDYAE